MVGKVDAKASVIMAPDADQVKISICPGVSTMMYFGWGLRFFSHSWITYMQSPHSVRTHERLHVSHASSLDRNCIRRRNTDLP